MKREYQKGKVSERSRQMSLVKSKNTKPEIAVRKILISMGFRYRLHPNDVYGCPDIAFKKKKKAIFVHGCFWHRHIGCRKCRTPKSRIEFWKNKFESNEKRDIDVQNKLKLDGWKVLVIWECSISSTSEIEKVLKEFLESD